jgi:hypothetical protein
MIRGHIVLPRAKPLFVLYAAANTKYNTAYMIYSVAFLIAAMCAPMHKTDTPKEEK